MPESRPPSNLRIEFVSLPEGHIASFGFTRESHYNYGEFMPACMKFWTPEQYVGVMFSSTKNKNEVTCPECLEWLHA